MLTDCCQSPNLFLRVQTGFHYLFTDVISAAYSLISVDKFPGNMYAISTACRCDLVTLELACRVYQQKGQTLLGTND